VTEIEELRAELELVRSELAEAKVRIDKLIWGQTYRPGWRGDKMVGICRVCGGEENNHRMSCRHYVGPLEHKWTHTRVNGTFGGIDHDCSCGGWFRLGGLAGHGDGTNKAEVTCPKAGETWRGPKPEDCGDIPTSLTVGISPQLQVE